MKYIWAQINANKRAHGKYFAVDEGEKLEDVVARHFTNFKIVDVEEVTKAYAEKHAKKILS